MDLIKANGTANQSGLEMFVSCLEGSCHTDCKKLWFQQKKQVQYVQ